MELVRVLLEKSGTSRSPDDLSNSVSALDPARMNESSLICFSQEKQRVNEVETVKGLDQLNSIP